MRARSYQSMQRVSGSSKLLWIEVVVSGSHGIVGRFSANDYESTTTRCDYALSVACRLYSQKAQWTKTNNGLTIKQRIQTSAVQDTKATQRKSGQTRGEKGKIRKRSAFKTMLPADMPEIHMGTKCLCAMQDLHSSVPNPGAARTGKCPKPKSQRNIPPQTIASTSAPMAPLSWNSNLERIHQHGVLLQELTLF